MTELFAFMALIATVATLVLYLVAALTDLTLMRKSRQGGVMIAVAAVLGIGYSLWAFYGAGAEATGWGAVLLAFGLPVYLFMRWANRSSPAAAAGRAAPPGSAA